MLVSLQCFDTIDEARRGASGLEGVGGNYDATSIPG